MKKWVILLVLIIMTSALSFVFHEPLSLFYMKTYYRFMTDEKEHTARARKLFEAEKHRELAEYIEPFIRIYPENEELRQIAGLNLIALGDKPGGAEILAGSINERTMKRQDIVRVARILYLNGSYGDLLTMYERGILADNVNCLFYYGVALYHAGKYGESLTNIERAASMGYIGDRIDLYRGLSLEQKGDLGAAENFLASAFRKNKRDRLIRESLIRVYRKQKKFGDAEKILRRL